MLRSRLSWCGEVTGGRKHYTVDYLGVVEVTAGRKHYTVDHLVVGK